MGIRARTTQLTSGIFSRSLGGLWFVVSTDTALGSLCGAGVPVPGVAGGVKVGLSRVAGGGEFDLPLSSSYSVISSGGSDLEE